MKHVIQKQSVKATPSKARLFACLGVLLLTSGIFGVAFRQQEPGSIHPTARKAIVAYRSINLLSLWTKVAPFAIAATNETRLLRLAFQEDAVFAIIADGRSVDGKHLNGKLVVTQVFHQFLDGKLVVTQPGRQYADGKVVSTNVSPSVSQADSNLILAWVTKCKDNGVCGFDLRNLPRSYRVAISNNSYCDVYLLVLTEKSSARFRAECDLQSERGFTDRGDVFCKVTNGVFIVTERR